MLLNPEPDLRILHAPSEIAGQMGAVTRAQRELGYTAHSCLYTHHWLGYEQSECTMLLKSGDEWNSKWIDDLRKLQFFMDSISKYDVFHFYFGRTLHPLHYDLPVLKKHGKKMVMHYWGDDIRQKSIAEARNRFMWESPTADEEAVRTRIRQVSGYIGTALVGNHDLAAYIDSYFERVVVIRTAVELKEYVPTFPSVGNKRPPVIVHAPSDKNIKGTEFVVKAVDRLKRERALEFVLVHGVHHRQAREIYRGADIVVDQLRGGNYGVFAVECMALGKPVIGYIRDDTRGTFPEELPIVSANPETIYEQLKYLLENPELRHDLGIRGRQYVEKHHDSLVIAQQLVDLYKSL